MLTATETLPTGYTPETGSHPTRGQIGVLYHPKFRHWSELQHLVEAYTHLDTKYSGRGIQSAYIGVLTADGESVGIGCLRYTDREGELSCLAVLPEHRDLGIGKWLIAERMRRAQELGLQTVYVQQLAPTNTLPSYYAELGFERWTEGQTADFFVRSPMLTDQPDIVCHL